MASIGAPELLLDPNKFSADGTSRLGAFLMVTERQIRSLWRFAGRIRLERSLCHGRRHQKTSDDHLKWIKNGGGSWLGDEGFFYSRYPEPEKGRELYSKNEFQSVWYHKIGTPQSAGRTDLRRQG